MGDPGGQRMTCLECGAMIAADIAICPSCGARQAAIAPVPAARSADPARASRVPASRQGTLPATTGNPLPRMGETFAGRYRVEKYLGLGALCNAYLCRDTGAGNRETVLKIMHARKAAEKGLADSFLFLAASVAKYDHKGIARVFDTGTHEGQPYYTMEWVGGTPLRLWLMERLSFDNRVLPGLGIIASLLDTFEAVHERGCYGSIKPENVFITLNGPVIMDFGVVGFLSPQEFEYNSYARRYLPYMAPELRQDWSNLLPQSDFYSVGALLYEVLAGRPPAPQLKLPSELSRAFGIEADEIILKAMAQRPPDRFATVEAFRQAVVSLQASLLARPREAGTILPAAAAPEPHASLEITSDPVSVHNPDEEFDEPGTGTLRMPGTGTMPVGGGVPWMREGSQGGEGERAPAQGDTRFPSRVPESESVLAAAATAESPDEDGRILSGFAKMGDRSLEEAHSKRRFAHGTGPLFQSAGSQADDAEDVPEAGIRKETIPGEDEPPVPAWLWIGLAAAGSVMIMLSAYLGLRGH
jgi:serine/threonine protein kinase